MPDDPTGRDNEIKQLRWVLSLATEAAGIAVTTGVVNKLADSLYEVLRGEGLVLIRLSDFEAEMLGGGA